MIGLDKYLIFQDEILTINEQILSMTQLSGINYDTVKVQSSPSDAMPDLIARLDKLSTRKEKLLSLQGEIIDAINALPNKRYGKILTYRYIMGYSWTELAERMSISDRWVRVLVRRAESRYYSQGKKLYTEQAKSPQDEAERP